MDGEGGVFNLLLNITSINSVSAIVISRGILLFRTKSGERFSKKSNREICTIFCGEFQI